MLNIKHSVDVKRVDHTLVAGFHRANPPLIWKFDLERNHSFTIGLQGEDGDWELGLTSPKGDFYPVARFVSHEDAEQAFHALQKALIRKKLPLPTLPKTVVGWVGLLIMLLGLFIFVGMGRLVALSLAHPGLLSSINAAHYNAIKSGVPQSADDVLAAPK